MSQVHAVSPSLRAAEQGLLAGLRRVVRSARRWIVGLATEGLLADAFLVTAGDRFVAVLLRRMDGTYAVDLRDPSAAGLAGLTVVEPVLARDAFSRQLRADVTLTPVWYS